MFYKVMMACLGCSIMAGCSSYVSLEQSEADGYWVAIKESKGTEIKVPDYYATRKLKTHYQIGTTYYVNDFKVKNKHD